MAVSRVISLVLAVPLCIGLAVFPCNPTALADGLDAVKARGVLRHVGVPYASFVRMGDEGLDVEVMRLFAAHLGVEYQFIQSDWAHLFTALTGDLYLIKDGQAQVVGHEQPRGDVAMSGITILEWRTRLIDFSVPTFPTQVWLISRADSPACPIVPGNSSREDLAAVRGLMRGHTILCVEGTCLDPRLYDLAGGGARPVPFSGPLSDIAPAVIAGKSDFALLDMPDIFVAFAKYPGEFKVLGPVSEVQYMAAAFPKESPGLRAAFDGFFTELRDSGEYEKLVRRYYPAAIRYFPEFFGSGAPR